MLTVTSSLGSPGISECGAVSSSGNAAHRRRSSHRAIYQRRVSSLIAGKRVSSTGRENGTELNGVSMERLTYISTALDALPGLTLREYFVPIMRLKKQLLLRHRKTKERFPAAGSAAYTKMVTDAIGALAKSLSSAGGDLMLDGGTAILDIDSKALAEGLQHKLSPICMEAGSVLGYPRELPETSFVYIVLSGTVTAMYFQPQPLPAHQRRVGGGMSNSTGGCRQERLTYFTSAKDTVRLCGGGVVPDAALLLDDHNNGTESGGAAVEASSMSNVTTAIQRSLRRASRTVGQPTLQYIRIEQLRGPLVLGASEAIGLAPCKYVTYTASAEPSGPAGRINNNAMCLDEVEVVQAFRVRTTDVHAALVRLAAAQHAERQGRVPFRCVPWCAAPPGEVVPRGATRTIADFIVAARRDTLCNDYAVMELMMRQSWLLQDAPSHTIRTLISHLVPRTYMPGEVIACPHTPGGERQLCFLRRGRLNVYAVLKNDGAAATSACVHAAASENGGSGSNSLLSGGPAPRASRDGCDCWHAPDGGIGARPAEVVESGASFGELSVLFQEPRHCVLRADIVCDAWCLPHRSFTSLMQRDTNLRDGLLQKAAVLRIEWMSEQRFTRTLAHQLRASSELLRPLPDIAIRLIQERLEPVVYAPGSLVVSMSTKCDEVIFIMHGSVTTICAGVATYGPGDVLGEGCLVPHRWPLGLAARTMVEGWRIKANQLSDAFRRMDKLHAYSGLVTSQTSQLMKRIFGNPQPEIEVDAVGRQRMPTVGPAPGGRSYLGYGRAVSEIQLKATCFLYRDHVRWEDINYSTIDGNGSMTKGSVDSSLDTLARKLAIQRLNGEKGESVATALTQQRYQDQQHRQKQQSATPRQQQKVAADSVTESPAGKENEGGPELAEKCKVVTTAAAAGSGRNAVRMSNGLARKCAHADRAGTRNSQSRVASAGAFLVKSAFLLDDASLDNTSAGVTGVTGAAAKMTTAGNLREKIVVPLPPRLQRMTRLLEERNRTWAAEQRHEATLVRQEASQREAAVRDQVTLHASAVAVSGGGGHRPNSSRGRRHGAATGASTPGAAATYSRSPLFSLADVSFAPVHIFLQSDKPKYELDLREAISIGYVMQLPDIAHIQHSVSLVDPDVALGPPAQRARRHLMSITPSDRYHKHNFLFAAAVLEDGSSAESQKAAAEATAKATLRSKARKLYTMMRTAVAARMDVEVDQINATPHRNTSGEYSPDNDSVSRTGPPETLMLADELHVRSPKDDVEGLVRSPLPAHSAPSPKPRSQPSQHRQLLSPPVVLPNSMATPSPFRCSPGKSGSQRFEEALLCMLQREPVQAIDLLRKHYCVPWSHGSMNGGGGGGVTSGQSSLARYATESRSTNGSGFLSSTLEASGESQRRAYRPSLQDRLEAAVAGGHITSPSGLPRVLPSRDGLHMDNHSFGATADGGDAEELLANGEVVLTNNTAPTFPPLVCATARDRWHSGNYLTPGSAPPAGNDGLAPTTINTGVVDSTGQQRKEEDGSSATAGAAAAAATPDSHTLCGYFYSGIHRRFLPALFVEGYGPLQPLANEWVEYPPTIQIAASSAAGSAGGGPEKTSDCGLVDRADVPAGGSRVLRLSAAIAVAAALRRSTSRPSNNNDSSPSSRAQDSVGGHGFSSPSQAFGDRVNVTAAPRMEPFVMPSLEDTEVVIRHIQRDVNGLNAVAREQRRERDLARLCNGRIVNNRTAVTAALGRPDEQEQELLETWRSQFARIDHDALRHASVPAALCDEGGPDYMRRELRQLANAPVPMEDPLSRYTKDMEVWQEQQQHSGRTDASPRYVTSALTMTGIGGSGGGAGGNNAQDGSRLVVATIGTSPFGFAPKPLQSPASRMTPSDSQTWTRQREDFFAAYRKLLDHPGQLGTATQGDAPALTAPALRFTPVPPAVKTTHTQLGSRGTGEPTPASTHPNENNINTNRDNTSYTAAFADFPATPLTSGSHKGEEEGGGEGSNLPSINSLVVPSVASAASIPSIPSPTSAMEDSANLHLPRPKQELPDRYESTPVRSHSIGSQEQVTPLAADHRVAVTPPRDTWNADDTQDYMDGSEEYFSGELEGDEEEYEEGEIAHSALLDEPCSTNATTEDSTAAAAAAGADTSVLKAEEEQVIHNEADQHAHATRGVGGSAAEQEKNEEVDEEEGGEERDENEYESVEAYGDEQEEEQREEGGAEADAGERGDRPAWLDI